MNTSASSLLLIEFKENSVHLLHRERGLDLPLEREPGGSITAGSAANLSQALAPFRGLRAVCCIPARGVSMRILNLPAADGEELERMLPLQVEAQFPLAPNELAWGYSKMDRPSGKPGFEEVLLAAVKRETLDQYGQLLTGAGLHPSFTVGALARCALIPNPPPSFNLVDVDPARSELISLDPSAQMRVRTLPSNEFLASIPAGKIYVTGASGMGREFAERFALNGSTELIELSPTPGGTAATLGLREMIERRGAKPLLLARAETADTAKAAPSAWKWPVLAAVLVVGLIALRLLEPVLQKPRLQKRLNELQAYRGSLPAIERELAFLQYMRSNQPPYLEAISTLAASAPRGTRFDSISVAGRGDLNVRGSIQNSQGAGEFRNKLIASGLFARIVLEEQSPVQNQQKINFRLSAQIDPNAPRSAPAAAPAAASTNQTNQAKNAKSN